MSRQSWPARLILSALVVTSAELGAQVPSRAVRSEARQGSSMLTVQKILVPATDPGKFNLQVDGINKALAVGHNGTTGAVVITGGTHSIGETAAAGTNLADYTTTFGGDCGATGSVTVEGGESKTCTITNTRRARLEVIHKLVPANDPGRFTLFIDGVVPGGPFGGSVHVGNGTTGFVTVSTGPHSVTEWGSTVNNTSLSNYVTSYSPNCPGGHITLQAGASATCTVTDTRAHGSWTQGPGTYSVTVCPVGPCTVHGAPGQSILLTFEVWGAGGGGGGGQTTENSRGGNGGGGGGGGGYSKSTIVVTVPGSGVAVVHVRVGAGGAGGVGGSFSQQAVGGGFSEVRLGGAVGTIVTKPMGGARGDNGHAVGATGGGGAGGSVTLGGGTITHAAGLAGGNGGVVTGCNGGGGGSAGAGGGPGLVNDGGAGGNGGYYNAGVSLLAGGCTTQGTNNGLTPGVAGKNGLVKLTW